MNRAQLSRACRRVNQELYVLGLAYHDGIPVSRIDDILIVNGFNPTEPAIYCGRDASSHEAVGYGKYLSLSWHKMESGRYEVTAYVN